MNRTITPEDLWGAMHLAVKIVQARIEAVAQNLIIEYELEAEDGR